MKVCYELVEIDIRRCQMPKFFGSALRTIRREILLVLGDERVNFVKKKNLKIHWNISKLEDSRIRNFVRFQI